VGGGGTGWRSLIGSPKSQIIFHKRATKYRSLLRKMTYKDKGSYESSPPCSGTRGFLLRVKGCGLVISGVGGEGSGTEQFTESPVEFAL